MLIREECEEGWRGGVDGMGVELWGCIGGKIDRRR